MPALMIVAMLGATAPALPFDLPVRTVVATFHAEGAQIYECKATDGKTAWAFREPIATLIANGKTVGRHFAGPHWAFDDGTLIEAKLAESLPGATPADIPLLKLNVVRNAGSGRLAQVTTVYRLNTHAGTLAGACQTPGEFRDVAYSADYAFAR